MKNIMENIMDIMEHKSGCGQRMAQKNLKVFETMMKT